MDKTLQYFSDDYLEQCKSMTASDILQFLDDYKQLRFEPGALKQINLRVPGNILFAFKRKAQAEGVLYQQKLRQLLTEWALS